MKNILALIFFGVFNTCVFGQNKNAFDYPEEIKKMGLEKLYNNTKWFLYCIESDRKVRFSIESGINDRSTTYGTLPLLFDHIEIRKDTIEIDFFFFYKGRCLDYPIIEYYPYWGAVYKGSSNKIILFSSRSHARYIYRECYDIENCTYREVKPLQPEVIKYIKQNKNKLDPWFRQEAIKRGVIK